MAQTRFPAASMKTATALPGDILALFKWRLSLAVATASLVGYLVYGHGRASEAAVLWASMLALAGGAGTLNNWQDRSLDLHFARTRDRPLPAGRLASGWGLGLAVALLAAGLTLLLLAPFPGTASAAAALAVVCYNGLYTPLKPRSLTAMIPGVLCGALPPMVGWLAAGGSPRAPAAWGLMTLFGLWQPPHFWLIQIAHRNDYGPGRLPSLLRVLSQRQLDRVLFAWVAALSLAMATLPLTQPARSAALALLLVVDAAALTAWAGYECLVRPGPDYRRLAVILNMAVTVAIALAAVSAWR